MTQSPPSDELARPMDDDHTKVHIDLPNHWGTGGEALWARSLGDNRYQIDNVPFYAYDLNYRDIVEAIPSAPDRKPSVIRVLERSGHRTLRIFFDESLTEEERVKRLHTLRDLHVTYERFGARYIALDLAPEADVSVVRDRLDAWTVEGIAEYETCEARVPGSFDDAPKADDSSST